MAWNQSSPFKTINSICHEIQAVLLNPDVFNPKKNSLGTIGFGSAKFECTAKQLIF